MFCPQNERAAGLAALQSQLQLTLSAAASPAPTAPALLEAEGKEAVRLAAEEPVAGAEDGEGLGTPRPEFGLRFRWSQRESCGQGRKWRCFGGGWSRPTASAAQKAVSPNQTSASAWLRRAV